MQDVSSHATLILKESPPTVRVDEPAEPPPAEPAAAAAAAAAAAVLVFLW